MSYDIAFGASQAQLNGIAAAVYQANPNLFNGTQQVPKFNVSVAWSVTSPPTIDLGSQARSALSAHVGTRIAAAETPPGLSAADATALASAANAFTLTIPVQLVIAGKTTYNPTLTAHCTVASTGNTLSFDVVGLSASTVGDPIGDYVIQNVLVPAVQTAANQLLSSINIPPINLPVLNVGPIAVVIDSGYVVGMLNLTSTGGTPTAGGGWPQGPFFLVLGANVVQTLVAYGVSQVGNTNNNGGSESWGFGYYWSYSLGIGSPSTGVAGSGQVSVNLSLTGGVSGGGEIFYGKIGVDFNASATPNPTGYFDVSISGGQVNLTFDHVDPFEIVVSPSGSWSEQILSYIVDPIVQAVVAVAAPAVSLLVQNIHIVGVPIPTVAIPIPGAVLRFSVTGGQTSGFNGGLAAVGQLQVQ